MTYSVWLKHVASGDIFELPYDSLTYTEELNNGGNASFQFDYETIRDTVATPYGTTPYQLFTAVLTEISIKQVETGTVVWLGVITDYSRQKDATATNKLTVAAVDYFAIFQKRRTQANKDYTAVDPATIPWDMISTSQALTSGDLGITQGATVSTGLTVTQNYKRADIKQSIADLSNLKVANSFDFDIDTTKKFNMYYPTKGSARPNIVFDDANILADSVKISVLLNMTNTVYARGQGVNNDVAEVTRAASAPTIAEYTLLEDITTDPSTADTTVLQNEGDKKLALEELPLNAVSLKHDQDTDITTYGLGDNPTINIPEEGISYDTTYRVKKRTVNLTDASGTMIVQLDFLQV